MDVVERPLRWVSCAVLQPTTTAHIDNNNTTPRTTSRPKVVRVPLPRAAFRARPISGSDAPLRPSPVGNDRQPACHFSDLEIATSEARRRGASPSQPCLCLASAPPKSMAQPCSTPVEHDSVRFRILVVSCGSPRHETKLWVNLGPVRKIQRVSSRGHPARIGR